MGNYEAQNMAEGEQVDKLLAVVSEGQNHFDWGSQRDKRVLEVQELENVVAACGLR
jgi:hypothetical protein